MTVEKAVIIMCDGCDESYPIDTFAPGTAAQHRRDLRAEGWRTNLPGGRDLCPGCKADPQHSAALDGPNSDGSRAE